MSLSDLNTENVVLLDFWATWCDPCLVQIPYLKELWATYKDNNFRIVSISLDRNRDNWESVVRDSSMNWLHIFQEGKYWDGKIAEKYDIISVPSYFLINKNGKIVSSYERGEELEEEIRKLIGKN